MPPLLVLVPSAGPDSKARVEQIRAVDKGRLRDYVGELADDDLWAIEAALHRILKLRPV